MRRPLNANDESFRQVKIKNKKASRIFLNYHEHRVSRDLTKAGALITNELQKIYQQPQVIKAFENICFIAELMKKKDKDEKEDEDWKYIASVVDRLFLIIFSIACVVSTCWILLTAPSIYDDRQAIDLQYRPTNLSYINPDIHL